MTLPARIAIVTRRTEVGQEPALQVGKLGTRHRADSLFLRNQGEAVLRDRAATTPPSSDSIPVECCPRIPPEKRRLPITIERERPLRSIFL